MGIWNDIEVDGTHSGYGAGPTYDEIVGIVEEIIGATGQGMPASSQQLVKSPAFQQALARKLAARAPVTKQVPPTKKRRWAVGFSGTGAANATVTIRAQPQVLFRGEKLIVVETPTGNTNITGIFIGNKPQAVTLNTPVPSLAFAANSLDNEMLFDTCQAVQFVDFQVQFVAGGTWQACLIGHAVQLGK